MCNFDQSPKVWKAPILFVFQFYRCCVQITKLSCVQFNHAKNKNRPT